MPSVFERSLRGASSSSAASKQAPSAEARKKKTVSWGDNDSSTTAALAGTTRENSTDMRGEGVVKSSTSLNTSFTGLGSIQEQGLDHLRVPSARFTAKTDTSRNHDLHAASTASSTRRRGVEPTIQAGAVRVRTPAKPKRPRAAATPLVSSKSSPPSSASPELRESRASPRTRSNLRRGGGIAAPAVTMKAIGSTRTRKNDAPAVSTLASPNRSPSTPKPPAIAKGRSPLSASPCQRPSPPSPRCPVPSGIALRNVAGGNAGDVESWADEEEDIGASTLLAVDASYAGRSPCSPRGLPPRSPHSPKVSGGGYGPPPSPSSASLASSSFTSHDRAIENVEEEEARRKIGKDGEEVRLIGK